jgi:predicted permease
VCCTVSAEAKHVHASLDAANSLHRSEQCIYSAVLAVVTSLLLPAVSTNGCDAPCKFGTEHFTTRACRLLSTIAAHPAAMLVVGLRLRIAHDSQLTRSAFHGNTHLIMVIVALLVKFRGRAI